MRQKLMPFLLPLLLVGLLTGCGTTLARLGRAVRPGVTLADGEYRGIARGCVPVTGTLLSLAGSADPRIAEAAPLVSFLGIEPVGCILSVEPRVATPVVDLGTSPLSLVRPYFIFCSVSDRAVYEQCATLPLNQAVVVTGTPLGTGGVIRPSRIVWNE